MSCSKGTTQIPVLDIGTLREMIGVAVAQADAGEFVDFDAESVIAEGTAILERDASGGASPITKPSGHAEH
jgi:hypothetical protein